MNNQLIDRIQSNLERKIFVFRGLYVMIEYDLAELYHVPTKRLNEQVKRNIQRFPSSFRFQLNKEEYEQLVAICDRLKNINY